MTFLNRLMQKSRHVSTAPQVSLLYLIIDTIRISVCQIIDWVTSIELYKRGHKIDSEQ